MISKNTENVSVIREIFREELSVLVLSRVALSRERGLMPSRVNSRGSRFWLNLWLRRSLRPATDCARSTPGSRPPACRGGGADTEAVLAQHGLSVMWCWLAMSWESSCVCGNKAELSFSFSFFSAAALVLSVICPCGVLWPRLTSTGAVTWFVFKLTASGCYRNGIRAV